MQHESDIEKMIDVVDTELSFESIYNKKLDYNFTPWDMRKKSRLLIYC